MVWRRVLLLALLLVIPPVVFSQDLPAGAIPRKHALGVVLPMETELYRLAMIARTSPESVPEIASSIGLRSADGRVRVIVEYYEPPSVEAIEALDGRVLSWARQFRMCEVEVPAAVLPDLAALPGVSFVRRPYTPVPDVVSEGVSLIGAGAWHGAGKGGAGIRVAVIDGGFAGLSLALAQGELANVIFTRDYTGTGLEADTEHGTACAEIVHDVAPGAELLLMKIGNEVDLANAVQDAIDNGAWIISHSMGWFNTNFYDGTGVIGDIVRQATSAGLLWVNASGNHGAGSHWEGNWQDADGDGYLEFAPGDEVNTFTLNAGDAVAIWLTWDAWPSTAEDYDLYLVDALGNVVASSEDEQSGAQPPTEAIHYTTPVSGTYGIVIAAYNVSTFPRLELFCSPNSLELEHYVSSSSIAAPGNAVESFTVGAISWRDWAYGPLEPYSSQGPTNASRFAAPRTKPDIAAPDKVSTLTYGPEGFPGTSASAPHVAGAAALVWADNPGVGSAWVRTYLENNAVDLGPFGKDNLYGAGKLSLPAPSPQPSPSPGNSHTYPPGWNMVSVPATGVPASVFGVPLWHWNGVHYETLEGADELDPSKGYWAYLPTGKTVSVSGVVPGEDVFSVLGTAGWHMISSPWRYPKGAIRFVFGGQEKSWDEAVAAGWVHDVIWGYNAAAGRYEQATVIDPWQGYWIKTRVNGLTIVFLAAQKLSAGAVVPPVVSKAVTSEGLPPAPPSENVSRAELEVANFPNPITDVHTTTFRVLGPLASQVEETRVRIFDLAGRLVWEGEAYGPELVWHTEDLAGRYLANGVYLYQVQVKVGGTWITTSLKKLAIYR